MTGRSKRGATIHIHDPAIVGTIIRHLEGLAEAVRMTIDSEAYAIDGDAPVYAQGRVRVDPSKIKRVTDEQERDARRAELTRHCATLYNLEGTIRDLRRCAETFDEPW